MKISSFDLNLFVIMNSIYTEGSLTKAAEVVGITQPAVSNALSRLREKFDDELFVRTGSGMVPTQKTENIIKDIQNALQLMQKSVNEPDEFNPATSQKTFRISLGDINEGRILAILMGKMEKQAPNIKLECYYSARDQVPHALATNELSFAVDSFIPNSKDTNSKKVFSDQFVVAHRANHPISKAKVIIEYGMHSFPVDPSFGSHFFQNVTSMRLGYFTIDHKKAEDFIDLKWIKKQKPKKTSKYIDWFKLENNLLVSIDGQSGQGKIMKPKKIQKDQMDEQETSGI